MFFLIFWLDSYVVMLEILEIRIWNTVFSFRFKKFYGP